MYVQVSHYANARTAKKETGLLAVTCKDQERRRQSNFGNDKFGFKGRIDRVNVRSSKFQLRRESTFRRGSDASCGPTVLSSASPSSLRQLPVNRPKALLTYAMRAFVGVHHCQLAFLRGTMRARIRLRALTFSEYPLVHRGQGSVAGAMLHFFHAAK